MRLLALASILACFLIVVAEKIRFDNHRVYSIDIDNEKQLKAILKLETVQDGIRFLETPTAVGQRAELVVAPHKIDEIRALLDENRMNNHIKIENFQKLIDEEQPENLSRAGFGWNQYYDLEAIYAFLDELLEKYPNVLTNYEYGTSYENRTLRAVKVSHKKGNPTIFIESTIHAREWITAATATYFLNELLTSTDAGIRKLADNYDWVIVPVTNVDGYAYTHSTNRMWRKTRKPSPTQPQCIGTDGNRNFDFHHAEQGASTQPCSETYAGPKAFSEQEIAALSEFIKTFDNLKLYISFHSYSQLLMFSYGHTYDHVSNHDDLLRIGKKSADALAKRYGTDYTVGNIAETIYLASGSSIDWVYGVLKRPLTFVYEFRDKGRYGFILPADQIVPNSLEVIDSLQAMVAEAESLNYL